LRKQKSLKDVLSKNKVSGLRKERIRKSQTLSDLRIYPKWAEDSEVRFIASFTEKSGRSFPAPNSAEYKLNFQEGRFKGYRVAHGDTSLVLQGFIDGSSMMWREVDGDFTREYTCEIDKSESIIMGSFRCSSGIKSTRFTMIRMP
jgi:hypothetical protein